MQSREQQAAAARLGHFSYKAENNIMNGHIKYTRNYVRNLFKLSNQCFSTMPDSFLESHKNHKQIQRYQTQLTCVLSIVIDIIATLLFEALASLQVELRSIHTATATAEQGLVEGMRGQAVDRIAWRNKTKTMLW